MRHGTKLLFLLLAMLLGNDLLAEGSYRAALADAVNRGMSIDQAVQGMVQNDPEHGMEIIDAATDLVSSLPYSACDDCKCGSGFVSMEYPVSELLDLEKKDWVEEVVSRYLHDGEQLMLPLYTEDRHTERFYYHFYALIEVLKKHLTDEDDPDAATIAEVKRLLKEKGFTEPVRLYLSSSNKFAKIYKGRALLQAAEELGMTEVPLRFAFNDCVLCEGRSDAGFHSVDEMRRQSRLEWSAERYFKLQELALVDKEFPSNYPFQYHFDAKVDELLEQFSGDPDEEGKKKWMEQLQKGMEQPFDLSLRYWSKSVGFEEEGHEILAAAKELGWETIPTRVSYLDQVTCRIGKKRTSFLATELFPEGRLKLVAERFFKDQRRLLFDEIGRHREIAAGYPFGKIFAYHAMVQVEELMQYLTDEQRNFKQEDIDKRIEELNEKGLLEPIFVSLEKGEKTVSLTDDSALTVLAVNQVFWQQQLPVRFMYLVNRNRMRNICIDLIREACLRATGNAEHCMPANQKNPPPPRAPGGMSES